MTPRHRRRRPLGDHLLRAAMRGTAAWCVAVCTLAMYAGAMPRFLP